MIVSMYGKTVAETTKIKGGKVGAKQSMRDECDINMILARYAKTGLLTPVVTRPPMFVDVSEVGDYRQAVQNVESAQNLFMELPATTRARFANDPAQFLDFATDPANETEMIELGLLPEPEKEPEVPPVVPPDVGPTEEKKD